MVKVIVMAFNATFNNISVKYVAVRKLEYLEKTKDLSQIIDTLDHIMLYRVHLDICGIQTRKFRGDMH
jgi:hypothetical protein